MIRINLAEQARPAASASPRRGLTSALPAMLVVVVVAGGIGWRYRASVMIEAALLAEIDAARSAAKRVSEARQEIDALEASRGELRQHVTVAEAFRSRQLEPLQILDHVSRSLPDSAWLTRLEQSGSEVAVEGQCASMTVLADFVSQLESTGRFQRPIAIVTSEATGDEDVVRFSIKATFQQGAASAR